MADEEPTDNVLDSKQTAWAPNVNQDEAILAQEKEIEREIAENIPLVGNKCKIETLETEYSNDDDVYRKKVQDLSDKYTFLRRTRPDGNCFFRAVSFGYLESLLSDKEEFLRFYKLAEESKDNLVRLGFPKFTIEDFHDSFMDVLAKIEKQVQLEDLLGIFNDQGYSDYIVVYMRLLTSGYLQKEEQFFCSFVEGGRTVKEFCHQEVEPMYRESDHIHIIALTTALDIGVRIEYMDREENGQVTAHDFPEAKEPRVFLLYRPGHYDILYK